MKRPTRDNLGFELAKASQRWNEALSARFAERGFAEVRPAYGSVLLPLFEEDGLRMGEIAARSRLAKQTMTTLVRLMERDGLVERERDPEDARALLVGLTARSREFAPVAAEVVAELESQVRSRLGPRRYPSFRRALREVMSL
jgi:MarR family transcriptional regulator, organic hydroperoxide resistance regulator